MLADVIGRLASNFFARVWLRTTRKRMSDDWGFAIKLMPIIFAQWTRAGNCTFQDPQ